MQLLHLNIAILLVEPNKAHFETRVSSASNIVSNDPEIWPENALSWGVQSFRRILCALGQMRLREQIEFNPEH